MTDIVERLRTRNGRPDGFGLGPVCDEAAAEIERLRAALATPPEWVLVPVEPTEAMQAVIRNECDIYGSEWALYAAMLAAAPGAPDALEGTP